MMKLSKEDQTLGENHEEPSSSSNISNYHQTTPRSILLQRDKGDFGFTLRHFIVYPPESLRNLKDGTTNQEICQEEAMDTIFVREVKDGSVAHQAGLVTGDRIITINGQSLAGKSYGQVIDLIQNSGDSLQLLVVPKEDDVLQLYFASSAYQPVDRRANALNSQNWSDQSSQHLQNTLSKLIYDMWYSHQQTHDPKSSYPSYGSTGAKSGSGNLTNFISRTMKAFIAHPPDIKMLSASLSSSTSSHSQNSLPPPLAAEKSPPPIKIDDSAEPRKGSSDLRQALSNQRREFFYGTKSLEEQMSPRSSYYLEEESTEQTSNSLHLVAQRLLQFESGTMQAKSLEKKKFYRSEISQMAGQSPTRIVSKRAAHFENLSPPKSTLPSLDSSSLWQEKMKQTNVERGPLCNNHPSSFSAPELGPSKPNGVSSETNGVIYRKKPMPLILSGSDCVINQPTDDNGVSRRISYLKATADERVHLDSDFSEEEELTLSNSETTPSADHKLQKLKSFFGEKTPHILNAIDIPPPLPTSKSTILTSSGEVSKQGWLVCKLVAIEGKRSSDRSWRPLWAILKGDTLHLLKEKKEAAELGVDEHTIRVNVALTSVAQDYTKRKHVLRLRLYNGTEYLLQAENQELMMIWLNLLQGMREKPCWTTSVLEKAAAYEQYLHTSKSPISRSARRLPFRQHRSPATLKSRRASHGDELALPKFSTMWKGKVQGWKKSSLTPPPGSSIGVRLEDCPESIHHKGVPHIMEVCVDIVESRGLEVVGIYRVPGNNAAISMLLDSVNQGINLNDPRWSDVNVVSSLLKAFFRKLPNPLIPTHLYSKFIAASKLDDVVDRLTSLRKLILQLPFHHLHTLKFLMQHLRKIVLNSKVNKMEARNLAIVFGPTLVRSADGNMVTMVTDMSHQCYIIETLIIYTEWLFGDDHLSSPPMTKTNQPKPEALAPGATSSPVNKLENGGEIVPQRRPPKPPEAACKRYGQVKLDAMTSSCPGSVSHHPSQEERVRRFELETQAFLERKHRPTVLPQVDWQQLDREWQKAKQELEQEDFLDSLAEDDPDFYASLTRSCSGDHSISRTLSHDNLEAMRQNLDKNIHTGSRPASLEGCDLARHFSTQEKVAWASECHQSQKLDVQATLPPPISTTLAPDTKRRHTIADSRTPLDQYIDESDLLESPSDTSRRSAVKF